jgi:hypothetical protein
MVVYVHGPGLKPGVFRRSYFLSEPRYRNKRIKSFRALKRTKLRINQYKFYITTCDAAHGKRRRAPAIKPPGKPGGLGAENIRLRLRGTED